MTNWLKLLNTLADQADKIALKYFQQVDLKVNYKKDNSPVSIADKTIEAMISKYISKKYPALSIFGEEFGETNKGKNCKLIIDPIDGTRNFIRGIPIFATLLAIEQDGHITAGLVSAPVLKTRWWAQQGQGAYCLNKVTNKKIKLGVSQINYLDQAQVFYGSIYGNEIKQKHYSDKLISLLKRSQRQRGFGDFYQHMLVAQGSGEAALDPVVSPWDIAPLKIILEEAGGTFTAFNGKESIYEGTALSSNGLMHSQILSHIDKGKQQG